MRGALTKIGDTFDRFTGRRWTPSSSLATSELIERIKKLLDAEAKDVPGKGKLVPHNIKLKMQWDKFSTDSEEALRSLENELLIATADHINDSLYYTYAPISLEVKPDYFVEGVKLLVSFDKFADEDRDVEMNVTLAGVSVADALAKVAPVQASEPKIFVARFTVNGLKQEKRLEFPVGGSISVGRTGSNAFVIDDASLSKIHASLSVDPAGNLSVADTGSTNGTFLNGQRISYGKATRLEKGDRVKFGMIEVEFEYIKLHDDAETGDPAAANANTVEIDGFEFTSRITEPDTSPANDASVVPDTAPSATETEKTSENKLKVDE